jgi:hypothetical protein
MNEVVWSEVSFKSTNGAYNLRFDLIEKTIWNNLSVPLQELAQDHPTPLLDALY